jgi:hypothetical protein
VPGSRSWAFLSEDADVLVDNEMSGVAPVVGAADLGHLPERRPSDERAVADRSVEGDDVLDVGEPGLSGEGDEMASGTAGSSGVMAVVMVGPRPEKRHL